VVKFSEPNSLQANLLRVRLPEPLAPGASIKLTLGYRGQIFGYTEVFAYVHDKIGEDYSLLRPDTFAYPMLAEPSFSSLSEAYGKRFTYELEAIVPAGYVVACGGELVDKREKEGKATFVYRSQTPVWRLDVAAARFKLLANADNSLRVYVLPGDEAGGARVLDGMERVVQFFTAQFGPARGGARYTAIEIPDGWGSQAGDYYFLQTAAAFKDPERLHEVYHEIGHSWNVRAKPEVKRARWFDEAFASYFEALALRALDSEKAFEARMTRYREAFRRQARRDTRNAETPIAEYGKQELGGNSYTKGAWSLYVLHRIVGEEKFREMIRAFLAEYGDRQADFQDFERLAKRVTARDLGRYFAEWIYGAESSRLLLEEIPTDEIVKRYQ